MEEIMPLITLLGFGFVLGLKHALDADHVIAVSTIVSETGNLKKSSLLGALWGSGHTLALVLVGLLLFLFKIEIPEKFALSFEFIVGILLVALGLNVLLKIKKEQLHIHAHQHDGTKHIHLHSHKTSSNHHHTHKSFMVGLVHGLAGSAALMLLVLTTVSSPWQALAYILIFGLGSTLGMLMISGLISLPFLLTNKFDFMNRAVKLVTGGFSIVFGMLIMYEIGFAQSLFF